MNDEDRMFLRVWLGDEHESRHMLAIKPVFSDPREWGSLIGDIALCVIEELRKSGDTRSRTELLEEMQKGLMIKFAHHDLTKRSIREVEKA